LRDLSRLAPIFCNVKARRDKSRNYDKYSIDQVSKPLLQLIQES
jgi:hypothetical protein